MCVAIPEVIPVSRDGGNYSSCMGIYSPDVEDNPFWGRVVASFEPPPDPRPVGWYLQKRWYAVLHMFDGWGKHIGTDHWFAGTTADGEEEVCRRASAKLDEMVAALGEVEWSDIEIGLFRVEIDGDIFGLIDVSAPEEGPEFADRVAMMPGDLLFHAPWDGSYQT
jgi:formate hydrogenlyase regulatory protein HycA